ncbi:tRNA (adenosine(37)-N6)-threonylcarbamoyltransferase complex dimerization subunit type 1 TsaB [Glaciecola sp. XM2]|jgi:tRNA threonylcarbamoyladenosine biosynthesis protein TsaB|uniref:tRNA (adenosine(37)-N6)-threonylcarbamoyltransferase complex dimerization subunit type 1 TsaB n=1 Tax=Glaciecola sp. XM2 TaxID=1914931 RepID=UPI001BDE1D5A|nr:tRNA (adenosine(37)-N6)-threonylcarbamoyltransferase complex dimerization subunit type 1 TsaB [Glaciecola sp. XM2]MBT1450947.1 tRNA (adenosine(37)-N6)-threonylcarbamoyltransferase complex dimerization subunit type 1 TsaB [Glaciecola sp. XM2]
MKILAIDTATEACSVGLLTEAGADGIFELCPQQHSQRILPMIDEVLSRNNLTLSDIDLLAYGRGPGSFTGVRIAASTVQGLALGADLEVVEVSTLQAMAQENLERFGITRSLALIDARMQEVYFGEYQANESGIAMQTKQEAVLAPASLTSDVLSSYDEQSYVGTGFHAYQQELGLQLQSSALAVNYPNALYMLALAKWQYEQGEQVTCEAIAPVYVRDTVTWKKLPNRE